MEYLVVWLIAAGVCAYFASKKGRSVAGWFVLGFLLPVVALVILWVLPSLGFDDDKSQEIARKFGVSSKYRKCPACAELVQREALKCKHCQTDLPAITE